MTNPFDYEELYQEGCQKWIDDHPEMESNWMAAIGMEGFAKGYAIGVRRGYVSTLIKYIYSLMKKQNYSFETALAHFEYSPEQFRQIKSWLVPEEDEKSHETLIWKLGEMMIALDLSFEETMAVFKLSFADSKNLKTCQDFFAQIDSNIMLN